MQGIVSKADAAARTACRRWTVRVAMLAAIAVPHVASAQTVPGCGELRPPGQYGPFDYRTDRDKLPIVENSHFTPTVQALAGGVGAPLGAELDYTLRAFPNHHKALVVLIRYGEKHKSSQPPSLRWSIDCYFDRAIRFKPDDPLVRMIYATYLNGRSRKVDALQQLAAADQMAADNGFTHYNIGLIYLEMKEYELALVQAHRAQALGFERNELRERLAAAGKWVEPAAAASTAGAAALAASAARP